METTKRKSGYYWVYRTNGWEVGFWSDKFKTWTLTGNSQHYPNGDMKQISEKEILLEL